MPRSDWTRAEVEAVVADYLDMFEAELRGDRYNKAEHRRQVHVLLGTRTEKAIEYKYQNASAALLDLGYPYLRIRGFQPLKNYQRMLREVVSEQIQRRPVLLALIQSEIEKQASVPEVDDILRRLVAAPKRLEQKRRRALRVRERREADHATGVDWLAREARNASLGRAGELFVVRFETARLISERRESLASKIEHVAVTRGDHVGFDVLSFDADGRERLIEVKTTAFGDMTPFFVSRNQVELSRQETDRFHLCRVFTFRTDPRLYQLPGALEATCELDPSEFSATPR